MATGFADKSWGEEFQESLSSLFHLPLSAEDWDSHCFDLRYLFSRIVLIDMARDWWTDPALSQGMLLPPLALYIAWSSPAPYLQAILQSPITAGCY